MINCFERVKSHVVFVKNCMTSGIKVKGKLTLQDRKIFLCEVS